MPVYKYIKLKRSKQITMTHKYCLTFVKFKVKKCKTANYKNVNNFNNWTE